MGESVSSNVERRSTRAERRDAQGSTTSNLLHHRSPSAESVSRSAERHATRKRTGGRQSEAPSAVTDRARSQYGAPGTSPSGGGRRRGSPEECSGVLGRSDAGTGRASTRTLYPGAAARQGTFDHRLTPLLAETRAPAHRSGPGGRAVRRPGVPVLGIGSNVRVMASLDHSKAGRAPSDAGARMSGRVELPRQGIGSAGSPGRSRRRGEETRAAHARSGGLEATAFPGTGSRGGRPWRSGV